MRALRIGSIALGLLVGALLIHVFSNALYTNQPVGFQWVQAPSRDSSALTIGVWYPTGGKPLPLTRAGLNLMSVARDAPVAGNTLPFVVISHGTGGGAGSHADLALALAQRGFVVAAPVHTGDNYADKTALGSARWLVARTRHVHSTLDYMLNMWPAHQKIDVSRIGMFGFSVGAFSALTAIGGQPDLRLVRSHCNTSPEFICKLLAEAHSPLLAPANVPSASDFARDSRIRAATLAAPALGFTFVPNGLAGVSVPVQLWTGASDQNAPTSTNAGPVSEALGTRAEFHQVPGASHFSFLVHCRQARRGRSGRSR